MPNVKITISDIETAKTIEYQIVNNFFEHNMVVFKHSFDQNKTGLKYDSGKCFINGNEVPYMVWTNKILYFVHFHYDYYLALSSNVPKLYGGD